MSVNYVPVIWNRQKKRYDRIMLGLMALYLLLFIGFQLIFYPDIRPEILVIRATATLALTMLHLILMIGPLTRINKWFMPLLYNRRHLGVSMFLIALVHGVFSIIQFHVLGDINPILSIFVSNGQYSSVMNFPFQTLGFFALIILFLMAATSHDFWLHNLDPKIWKGLHMMVYVAYVLIILHVMLGVVQLETNPVLVGLLAVGALAIIGLHLTAGIIEARRVNALDDQLADGFIEVCAVGDIPENRAKMAVLKGENIAIFKYEGKISAIHNVCKHQNGPLGEGKIVDGCVTCPWHGYQYLPENGQSPPPFTELLKTYHVKVQQGKVFVNPTPNPEGTPVEPALISA